MTMPMPLMPLCHACRRHFHADMAPTLRHRRPTPAADTLSMPDYADADEPPRDYIDVSFTLMLMMAPCRCIMSHYAGARHIYAADIYADAAFAASFTDIFFTPSFIDIDATPRRHFLRAFTPLRRRFQAFIR